MGERKTPEPPRHLGRSRQRPSERGRVADPARRAAYTTMRAIDEGAYANLELPQVLRRFAIDGRDAAFATELTYGATRLRGRYDPIIAHAAGREVGAIDAAVLDTLRLGVHQVLGMRVPAHAAVAETVALARQVNGAGAAGFVNAVLRRVSERDLDSWLAIVAPGDLDPLHQLAIRESHPTWIVKAIRDALIGHGRSTRESVERQLAEVLAADNVAPPVTLAARPGLSTVEELVAAGARPGSLAPTAAVLAGGDPGNIPAIRDGRAAVQDEGSQLVALVLAAVPIPPEHGGAGSGAGTSAERWLDLCAGPGGKAGLLAGLAIQRGASLVANELTEHRAELVRQTLRAATMAAQPGQIEVRTGDGREVGELEPAAYDRVLVDAPCTGLGALRRRPEARWRRTPADLVVLTKLQRDLLSSALDATRPGGVVVYVTCSPHLSETVFAVGDVLKKRADVEVLDASEWLLDKESQPIPDAASGRFAQLWPDLHGTDAMFVARLRRL
ncbi:MAG: rRNA small subunit methyltransferase B [Actinomycetales bacterium]|nr:rRNA small subunit methyltransferase B [Actinomycetales bacterium]